MICPKISLIQLTIKPNAGPYRIPFKTQKILFENIGLKEEDINELDIYEHSIPELEEKAYAILGKKLAEKKQEFSVDKEETKKTNRVDLSQASKNKKTNKYGNLFAKYGK